MVKKKEHLSGIPNPGKNWEKEYIEMINATVYGHGIMKTEINHQSILIKAD